MNIHGRILSLLCILALPGLALAQPAAGKSIPPFVQSPAFEKFQQELRGVGGAGIPVAVSDGTRSWKGGISATHYTIDINQFTDQLYPGSKNVIGPTTLWGYNPTKALGVTGVPVQKHLGGVIVAKKGTPVQITFRNNLPPKHILPVDTTIMGADGPVNRTSTHLHGGLTPWISDGGPYATWDPKGNHGISFLNNQVLRPGENVPKNEAEFYYTNQESARMEWYHDHAIGITRLNAYAGVASAYIIRDDFEGLLVSLAGLPKFVENGGRELPIVIQDKIFEPDHNPIFPGSAKSKGSLWYPYTYYHDRWDSVPGTTQPTISVVPEMFGDTNLVNGTILPKATVDPRRYRLRILDACQARFYNLQLYEDDGTGNPNFKKPGPDWLVIGTEGGFLAKPVVVPSKPLAFDPVTGMLDPANPGGSLITAPAERWDVIVDFNGKGGKKYILCNDAPAPFPMGDPLNDYDSTRILMRFEVKADSPAIPKDPTSYITPSLQLAGNPLSGINPPLAGKYPNLPAAAHTWLTATTDPLPIPTRAGIKVRQLTLNEMFDEHGRLIQMLGTNLATSVAIDPTTGMSMADFSRMYASTPTETPRAGATEVWQIVNLTGDTHPIHFHLANAQLLSRQPFDAMQYVMVPNGKPGKLVYTGAARGPLATELGWKDTIKMNPGEVTTVIMKFDLPSVPFAVPFSPRTGGYEYVWHCHILDHEEHDMMRPLIVMP